MQLSDEEELKQEQVPIDDFESKIKKEKKEKKKDKKKKKRKHKQLEDEQLDGAVDNMEDLTKLDNEAIKNLSYDQIQKNLKILEKKEQREDNDFVEKDNDIENIDDQIDQIDQELTKFEHRPRKETKAEQRQKEIEKDTQAKSKMDQEGAARFDQICQRLAEAKRGSRVKPKDSIETTNLTVEETIKQLDDQMEGALLKDIQSNKAKKPAFLRFQLLNKIDTTLRKLNLQEDYLEKDGCQRLSDWLKPMPDNTYPNQKIILCIMGCVDRLPISQDQLKDSDLENSLEIYRNGQAGPGYIECQRLAKNIMDKWYREKFNIQTTYDQTGQFDAGYSRFQNHLQKERDAHQKKHNGNSDDEESSKKRQKVDDPDKSKQGLHQSFEQLNCHNFLKMQTQNSFTTRPDNISSRTLDGYRRRINNSDNPNGWSRLKKTLAGLKKKVTDGKKPLWGNSSKQNNYF